MMYSDIGKPELTGCANGWAHFAGGYMAHLSRWDEYCRGYTTDFTVYVPETPAETRERMRQWLDTGIEVKPPYGQPDARSMELQAIEDEANKSRWQQAMYNEQKHRDELAQEQRARQQAAAVQRTFIPYGGSK